MINVDELTLGQIRELQNLFGRCDSTKHMSPYIVGKAYLIRTVTNYLIGRVVCVMETEIIIEDASWVADTGRYANAIETGVLKEVEPYPDGNVIVGRGSVVDACEWRHPLPRDQK